MSKTYKEALKEYKDKVKIHIRDKNEPTVCPICKGKGVLVEGLFDKMCKRCDGEGYLWH